LNREIVVQDRRTKKEVVEGDILGIHSDRTDKRIFIQLDTGYQLTITYHRAQPYKVSLTDLRAFDKGWHPEEKLFDSYVYSSQEVGKFPQPVDQGWLLHQHR